MIIIVIISKLMENHNTNSKADVFLKAGIPLAIALAGYFLAKLRQPTHPITSNHLEADSLPQNTHEEEEGTESPSIVESSDEDTYHDSMRIESWKIRVREELEAEMKHQEHQFLELHNKLSNEIARVKLSERQISSLEAELLRLENIGLDEYNKIVKLLAVSGLKNRLLRKRVKKLFKKTRLQSHLIKEQSLKIEAKETEMQRNYHQLEVDAANVRRNMEDEIEELKTIVAELQNERNKLVDQIDLANKTISSQIEEVETIKASYKQVVCETEQMTKERAIEAKELVYLRWCNACLRHELTRRNQEQSLRLHYDQHISSDIRSDDEIDYSSRSQHTPHHLHPPSKRVKIVQKLKRWMDKH